MVRIPGVQTKRNAKGAIQTVTIDAKKHPQVVAVLKGMGLIEKSPLQQEIEENPEDFMTVEEAEKKSLESVRAAWKRKYQ